MCTSVCLKPCGIHIGTKCSFTSKTCTEKSVPIHINILPIDQNWASFLKIDFNSNQMCSPVITLVGNRIVQLKKLLSVQPKLSATS